MGQLNVDEFCRVVCNMPAKQKLLKKTLLTGMWKCIFFWLPVNFFIEDELLAQLAITNFEPAIFAVLWLINLPLRCRFRPACAFDYHDRKSGRGPDRYRS